MLYINILYNNITMIYLHLFELQIYNFFQKNKHKNLSAEKKRRKKLLYG